MTQELTWRFDSKMRGVPAEQVPSGPWDEEPDKVQWVDETTGYDCLVVRGPAGALCGYVGVPPEHPAYGKGYEKVEGQWHAEGLVPELRVHGGLTFAEFCTPGEPIEGICHIAEHGATEKPWWLGFDCAHLGDDYPMDHWTEELLRRDGYVSPTPPYRKKRYRNLAWVQDEVRSLAKQLKAVA